MTPTRVVRLLLAAALGLALVGAAPAASEPAGAASAPAGPTSWRTTVFARVPPPGHPAYVFVHRNGRVYTGTYESGDARRSRVLEHGRSGALLRSWTVPGQRRDGSQGVQVANQTRDGKLVLLETSRRAVMTLDVRTGRFRRVATLPPGSVPNYATWGPRDLFVSDYGRGVVWRVRRDGSVHRWFASPVLDGVAGFGTAGIVYRPGHHDLLITQQTVADGSTAPTSGALLSLGVRHGRPGRLRTLWTSRPGDLPDGFGIGRSGHVYIAQAGLPQQLVEVDARGREVDRFPDVPLTGDNGSPIPFDTPCSATFAGTSVLVANQSAVQGDASHMAILRVHVGERGRRPHLPRGATFR